MVRRWGLHLPSGQSVPASTWADRQSVSRFAREDSAPSPATGVPQRQQLQKLTSSASRFHARPCSSKLRTNRWCSSSLQRPVVVPQTQTACARWRWRRRINNVARKASTAVACGKQPGQRTLASTFLRPPLLPLTLVHDLGLAVVLHRDDERLGARHSGRRLANWPKAPGLAQSHHSGSRQFGRAASAGLCKAAQPQRSFSNTAFLRKHQAIRSTRKSCNQGSTSQTLSPALASDPPPPPTTALVCSHFFRSLALSPARVARR